MAIGGWAIPTNTASSFGTESGRKSISAIKRAISFGRWCHQASIRACMWDAGLRVPLDHLTSLPEQEESREFPTTLVIQLIRAMGTAIHEEKPMSQEQTPLPNPPHKEDRIPPWSQDLSLTHI